MKRNKLRPRWAGILVAVVCSGMPLSSHAGRDILDQPVTLSSESDLVTAVGATLQHALITSEQFQPRSPRLQRFVRKELETRRKTLKVLTKRSGITPPDIKVLAIEPKDDRRYVQAMLRNHARLLEIIEHGMGLSLAPDIKRMMTNLASSAIEELSALGSMERSRSHVAMKAHPLAETAS